MTKSGQRVKVQKPLLCRMCGAKLTTDAEQKIGVHIGCVAETIYKPTFNIPSPQYGQLNRKPDR